MVTDQIRVDAFGALADPTRREILSVLAKGPLPVHQLAERFPISRPAISKHLRVLRSAELIVAIRSGKENLYEINPAAFDEVFAWLNGFWADRLNTLKALAEKRT